MATPTEVTTEMDVPITVAVPVVQDSHEKPWRSNSAHEKPAPDASSQL